MGKMLRNDVRSFLSWKQVILISLAISIGFHFVFMLAFFFGETIVFGPEKSFEKRGDAQKLEYQVQNDTLSLGKTFSYKPDGRLERSDPKPKKFIFWRILMHSFFSFIKVCGLFFFNRRILGMGFKKQWVELLLSILGTLLLAATLSILFSYLPSLFDNPKPRLHFLMRMIRDGLTRDLSMAALVVMVCYLLRSLYHQRIIAVENEELRTENIRTHYEALKSQLDPHFLFNSMNTLQSLITIDKDAATDYVQQLSSVLRYTLQSKEVVTLTDEMNCVQAYCSMMQIRFGDNLHFDFQIDKKYDNYKVLPLSIQELVENAIKHNIVSAKQPLKVSIVTNDANCLKVSNAIQPKIMDDGGNGIGLANLVERYRLQWDAEVGISNNGKVFEVSLPLIEN